jgi:hypothetical protein
VLGAVGVDDRDPARVFLRVLPEAHRRAPLRRGAPTQE